MLTGLDRLSELHSLVRRLRSERVGLLAHPASVDARLTHISRVLEHLDIKPTIIFGPEHGYGGEAQDMVGVLDASDPNTGAPIISLYGDCLSDLIPPKKHLDGLQTLIIDLCDVGSRYYTFVWTAWLAVKAACDSGVRCVILDRPNPIGGSEELVEGAVQRPGFLSFVGWEPVAVRHGLTLGEVIAALCAREGLTLGLDGQVLVVGVQGWDRATTAHQWARPFVPPSPNMPTPDTALVYPGGCLLEGTLMSEGRGTTKPFEWFGAPWLDGARLACDIEQLGLPGFQLRPMTFTPMFHKHAGKVCGGVQVHVTDPVRFRPFATYLALIAQARRNHPEQFAWRTERYEFVDDIPAIDLLTGSSFAREAIETGEPIGEIIRRASHVDDTFLDWRRETILLTQRTQL